MCGNDAVVVKGCTRINDQPVAYINRFPSILPFSLSTASNLKGDQHNSLASQLHEQVGLDGSDKPVIVPVHQAPLSDCIGQIH